MPATVRNGKMPHNNRMQTSGTLKTHSVWKQVIKYDPYAAEGEDSESRPRNTDSYKNYMQLARLSGNTSHMKNRGACRKCGMMGHMTFQCMNAIGRAVENDDDDESDNDSSSEEEEERKSRVRKRRHSDEEEDSDDEEERRARKRRRKRKEKKRKKKKKKKRKKKKRKKKRKRKEDDSESSGSSSSSDSDSD